MILPVLYQDVRECMERLMSHGFSGFREELNSMLAFRGETVIGTMIIENQ